jgi:hypothetical protein
MGWTISYYFKKSVLNRIDPVVKRPSTTRILFLVCALQAQFLFAEQRSFLMGTTMIAELVQPVFENLDDKDLLSLHLDDFLGIPWTQFQNGTALPSAWTSQWATIQSQAASSGKVLYLALSPLKNRKILTDNITDAGTQVPGWAPVDGDGCYPFATDANAQAYKVAYINYLKYLVNLIHPTYLSPGIEINVEWNLCPQQKVAFKQWYVDVHQAMKVAYPNLIVFPTFQVEHLYGIADAATWCGGIKTDATLASCFEGRLDEALATPADRAAFSTYPFTWLFPPTPPDNFTSSVPYDAMFTRVQERTRRKIWISETGWQGVRLFDTYQHASPAQACGSVILPSPLIAGESNMANHLSQLLAQAQSKQFEAVVWWQNRDLIDATIADLCPCAPGGSTTCSYNETLYQIGGASGELSLRLFGNMGLRHYDGSPRASVYNVWSSYFAQPYSSVPIGSSALGSIQVYPNPLRSSQGHTGINFLQLPPSARLRVYTLAGEKVRELTADRVGHANWDGKNESGHSAASGVYVVYVQGGGESKTLKVAIQR